MKTKEEILKQLGYTVDGDDNGKKLMFELFISQAMDEHAKQIAMEFTEWCDNFGYRQNGNSVWCRIDSKYYPTTAELFDKFVAERQV